MSTTMRYTPPAARPTRSSAEPAPRTTYVWSGPRRGLRHHLGLAAVTALAVRGVLTGLAGVAQVALDVRPLVVRSGSMAPALPVGSLALARPAPVEEIERGDVISVVRGDGTRVTHRVVGVEGSGALRRLITQGDANSRPDTEPVTASEVDRVVLTLPTVGRVLQLRGSTAVHLVAAALVGAALCWSFGPPTARRIGRWVPDTGGAP